MGALPRSGLGWRGAQTRPAGRTALAYGVATAAYQIEGAVAEDGRGPSIWDTFAARPGTVRDGRDGSVACDSYHRYEEDLDLVAGIGAGWYRFSIAWPRIVPEGIGRVESRGLDYYDRLVDAALARGVSPTATLYHWDLPQPLEDRDGWLNRDTAEAFADYATVVHDRLGDRVQRLGHPQRAVVRGLPRLRRRASTRRAGREGGAGHRAAHHLMLGHGLAAARLHEAGATDVGIVLNLAPFWPEDPRTPRWWLPPTSSTPLRNRLWLGPLVDGAYDEGLLAVAPELADPELVRDGDLDAGPRLGRLAGRQLLHAVPRRGSPTPASTPHPEAEAYPGARPRCRSWSASRAPTSAGRSTRPGSRSCWSTPIERTGLPILVTENGAAYPDDASTRLGSRRRPGPHRLPARPHRRHRAGP